MTKKGSTSRLSEALSASVGKSEVPLIAAYRAAIMSVCGLGWVYVRDSDKPRFLNRQQELDDEGIDYHDYAATVVKTWYGWCQIHGMNTVSAPIFCGPKALARYKRDKMRHSNVVISAIHEDEHYVRLQEEMTVALMFVGGWPYANEESIRTAMEPSHVFDPDPEIVKEVLALLREAYHVDAWNYEQLARQFKARGSNAHIRRGGLSLSRLGEWIV